MEAGPCVTDIALNAPSYLFSLVRFAPAPAVILCLRLGERRRYCIQSLIRAGSTREAPVRRESELPLEGLKVLDSSSLLAGPLIATHLADYGAEVIKVERPEVGDTLRNIGWEKDGVPLWWKVVGRNKKSVTLDLHEPRAQDLVRDLCTQVDVLIENFRPGRLESWGLGWDRLHNINDRLIMVRTTGFGQFGPNSQRPGFGTLAEAMSGFAYVTGDPEGSPTLPPFGLADSVAALMGTCATMFALYERDVGGSGKGQYIDLAILEPMFSILGPQATVYDQLGIVQERMGNGIPFVCPRNMYKTSDGRWVALSASAESIARRVFQIIERPEMASDPRYSTNAARLKHRGEVDAVIAEWMSRHSQDEVMAAFDVGEGAIAPVFSIEDLMNDAHLAERGAIVDVPDEELGSIRMQGVFPFLSRTPGRVVRPGPRLGEHTEEILTERLGLSLDEIEALRAEGVI